MNSATRSALALVVTIAFTTPPFAATVYAQTIVNVDITNGSDQGPTGHNLPGVIGKSAPTWNPVLDQMLHANLLDENGDGTSVNFQLKAPSIDDFAFGGGPNDFFYSYAYLEGGNQPTQGGFTIGGLDDSNTYDIYLYAAWEFANAGSEFSLDGGTTWKLSDGVPSESDAPFVEGSSYVSFLSVSPESGDIDGLWRTTLAGESTLHRGMFNALQIVERQQTVPEPQPWMMWSFILAGLVGFCVLRRRKLGDR